MRLPAGREGWRGVRAVVSGFGPDGAAATDNLLFLGAEVTVIDEADAGPGLDEERAELLRTLGADIRFGPETPGQVLETCDLMIVASSYAGPARAPDEGAWVSRAETQGMALWSAAELAWRLRGESPAPWLVAAGEPGELGSPARVIALVAAMAEAGGLRVRQAGGFGPRARAVIEAVMDPEPVDVLAVALDEAALRHSSSIAAESAVVMGHAPVLARAYQGVRVACVYADDETERFVAGAEVVEGARAIGLVPGTPGLSMLGVVDDLLVDRAFIAQRRTSAAELATVADVAALTGGRPPSSRQVREVLAAAALVRAHGLSQAAVRDGIRAAARVDFGGGEW